MNQKMTPKREERDQFEMDYPLKTKKQAILGVFYLYAIPLLY